MPLVFLLLLILFVWAELSLVIAIGGEIGALGVLAEMAATVLIGVSLVRRQGLSFARRMNEALARGKDPVTEVSQGFFLFLAGILLILPGFLTDAMGLILLIPPVRKLLIGRRVYRSRYFYYARRDGGPARTTVIEGEYEERDSARKKRIETRATPRRGPGTGERKRK